MERTRLRLFQFSIRDQASNWLESLPAGSITTWEDLTTRFLAKLFPPGRIPKLCNDILMFQQHHEESLSEAWTRFKDLLRKVPHHRIDLWLQVQIFNDNIDHTLKRTMDYAARGRLRKLSAEKAWATIEELARYEDKGWNDLVASGEGSLDSENPNIKQLLGVMECKIDTLMKEAISLMGRSEIIFGMTSNTVYQLSSEPSRQEEFENLVMNFILDQEEKFKQLEEYMGVIGSDFMQLSLESWHDAENPDPQSTPQVLPSFEEYTPPVTNPKEVEETLGIPIEVEPLDEPQLEDLRLNTCNHDITLSSKKIPSIDEPEPQLLPNSSSLDVILGDRRGTDPPINPCIPGGFRKKVVDSLTVNTPPSPHVAYYHLGLGNPKKHYGFKPGLLGQSGSLGVDFSNIEMIENNWELEFKEAYFLERGLNSPIRPKEVEKVRTK
ncbi:zinc finger, CCHC-type containing protein [Tanacetum coccineum]